MQFSDVEVAQFDILLDGECRSLARSLAESHCRSHDAGGSQCEMRHRHVASGDDEAVDLLRYQTAVRDVVAVRTPVERAVAAHWMVKVHRITCNGDDVVEPGAVEDVVLGQNVFPDDATGFADAHERSDAVHVCVLETGDVCFQIAYDLLVLLGADDLALRVLCRVGCVDAVDARHVHPPLVGSHARHEDGTLDREFVACLAGLLDLVAEADERTVVVRAEELVGDEVDVVYVRMVGHGVAQFARIDSAHRKHERRRLRDALFVAVVHRCPRTVGDVAVARTVDDAFGENRFAPLFGVDDYAFDGVALHDDVGCEGVHQ